MAELFGTDGIRGEANRYPMDAGTAFAVGQALTREVTGSGRSVRVVIGRDTRLSGHLLESALASGVASMGGTPYLVGVVPTPGIAFAARQAGATAGVVISASHNPYEDNGIKIFSGDGFKLSVRQEQAIEELVLGGRLPEMVAAPSCIGRVRRSSGTPGRYAGFLKATFSHALSLRGMKVVLDTANGATYRVAPAVFGELGAELTVIHNRPDGLNINEGCGSQHTEDLRKAVVDRGATVGLAFDGDGDRLVAVDEGGRELTGDQVMIICALMLKAEGRLKNNLLVSTVMSNMGLSVACKRHGIWNHAAKVGDRQVVEDLVRLGGVLGGEESGHMVFLEHHTTGDGVLSALQLLGAMLKAGKPLSELAKLMEIFPQKLVNVQVKSKPDLQSMPAIMDAIRKVQAELAGSGRVLVRYSGTEDLCRVMVEGPTPETTEKQASRLAEVVKASIG